MCLHLQLIHVVVLQKLSQHCKTIILQFKKNEIKKKRQNPFKQPLNSTGAAAGHFLQTQLKWRCQSSDS